MRLQAVVTEQVFAAGVRWQNQVLAAVGALGRGVHHREQAARRFRLPPQPHQRVLQIVEVYHGYADREEFHQTVPEQLSRHVRVTDDSGSVSRYRLTGQTQQKLYHARLHAAMEKEEQINELQEIDRVRSPVHERLQRSGDRAAFGQVLVGQFVFQVLR